jgi:hypothetical protein
VLLSPHKFYVRNIVVTDFRKLVYEDLVMTLVAYRKY